MTIQRHPFDGVARVRAAALDELPVLRWEPPTIGEGGKLIHAEPREESVLRQTVAQVVPRAGAGTGAVAEKVAPAPVSAAEAAKQFDQAREEGLLIGRQEGLQKGLEEGRKLGLEQGRQQGLAEGREQGQKEGYQDAWKQAEAEINQQKQTLASMITHLSHAMNEEDYQLEQALLNLSREIARHVVQRELMLDSSHIINIVRQALATLPPSRDNVRILVSPEDHPLVQQAIAETGEDWRVVASRQIERGGCRVETDQSAVDFTTSERFKQVLDHIVQRQFADSHPLATRIPAGEEFEPAPEPVIRPAVHKHADAKTSGPSLLEEAEALLRSQPDTLTGGAS